MKRLALIGLSLIMILCSITSVSAVEEKKSFEFTGTDTIPNNILRLYNTNENINSKSGVRITDMDTTEGIIYIAPKAGTTTDIYMMNDSGYRYMLFADYGGYGDFTDYHFKNTGGVYKRIKFKLSDYFEFFNEDGTHTSYLDDTLHNYNFTCEDDGHSSILIVESGGAITFTAPDENGMFEFYISTNIGQTNTFKTVFSSLNENGSFFGEPYDSVICDLTVGDVDKSEKVSVADATYLQKHLAGFNELDELGLYRSDTNNDGKVNVVDATAIQKYVVGLK